MNIMSAIKYAIFALFYPNCRYVDDRQNSPVEEPILQLNSPVLWRQKVHMYASSKFFLTLISAVIWAVGQRS